MENLKPIIKWAGGKEKELPYIKENLPKDINNYIEPFVGGGSVYFSMNINNSYINDKSTELINLYKCIQSNDTKFYKKISNIYKNWRLLEKVVNNNQNELLLIYKNYCSESEKNGNSKQLKENFKNTINNFVSKHSKEFNGALTDEFTFGTNNFIKEINKNLISKMSRMHKIEKEKGKLILTDTLDNFECAFKSAFYMHLRFLYNNQEKFNIDTSFYEAIFYFIREYCYASMFRYNKNGKFNVPYGGISYNRKEFGKKIEYISSKQIQDYMKNTKIYEDDFEVFLNKVKPKKNDFIFVDPPYDTEFSTYAKNTFDQKDQIRLADYLSNTDANVMIIIKNTNFIHSLYKERGFKIESFDKKYLVSFQNRNEKNVEHLLITNY